jgi:hypothetical protein
MFTLEATVLLSHKFDLKYFLIADKFVNNYSNVLL